MSYYLSKEQLHAHLNLGKAVEQWLGVAAEADYHIIRWLRVDGESNGQYTVTCFEIFDDGDSEFLDIYEFSPVDPDNPYGVNQTFETKDEAIEYCVEAFKASKERFVAFGMIQQEYEHYISSDK